MSGLTVERLQELRRIAESATPGPWAWRMNKDGRILDLITLETGHNEEILAPSHINAWLQFKDGVKDFIPTFDPPTVLALLDEIEHLRRERKAVVDSETRFELCDPDLNAWECQACRFWWEFEVGDPYDHDMRFCPRCGRRIVEVLAKVRGEA